MDAQYSDGQIPSIMKALATIATEMSNIGDRMRTVKLHSGTAQTPPTLNRQCAFGMIHCVAMTVNTIGRHMATRVRVNAMSEPSSPICFFISFRSLT